MNEVIDLILSLSKELNEIKTRIELWRLSKAKRLKDTWNDHQDVLQILHIRKKPLKTVCKNGGLSYSEVKSKFYYKATDIEEQFQRNYYNPNFTCDGIK
jgi:hypothetical protein